MRRDARVEKRKEFFVSFRCFSCCVMLMDVDVDVRVGTWNLERIRKLRISMTEKHSCLRHL